MAMAAMMHGAGEPSQTQPQRSYVYDSLDAGRSEFRILMLPHLDPSEPLSGTLKVVSMLDEPKPTYKTISYAWGDTALCKAILLDGMHLGIPASADDALRGILNRGYSGAIWIDSVCINQGDVREREHQVAMMGSEMSMYRHTQLNLVWLGPGVESTPEAIEGIEAVLRDMQREINTGSERAYETLRDWDLRAEVFSGRHFSEVFDHSAVYEFFEATWFSRLWVVQEAVLAPSSMLICGDFELFLNDVIKAGRWCIYKRNYLLRRSSGEHPPPAIVAPAMLFELIHKWQRRYQEHSLITIWDCLQLSSVYKVTLPVDVVYATLGMLDPSSRDSEFLRPHYEKSVTDVLRDATFAAGIEVSWNILGEVHHLSDEDVEGITVPSWVPRWSSHRGDFNSNRLTIKFKASSGLQAVSSDHETMDEKILLLEGLCIDAVVSVNRVYRGVKTCEDAEQYIAECQELCAIQDLKAHDDTRLNAFARTMISGVNFKLQPAQEEDLRAFDPWLAHIKEPRPIPALTGLGDTHSVDTVAAAEYDQAFERCSLNRRFFTTRNGRIGLGPQLMQSNDCVVILASAGTPYILRKDLELFHLVGQCYVDGIMAGEAVQEHYDNGGENTLFRIR